jgi:hypothetical protein
MSFCKLLAKFGTANECFYRHLKVAILFTTGMQSSGMEDFSGLQGKSLYSGSGILW